jgi:chromosome segregation ATPase
MQSNDISLERFEKSQEIIQDLKSQITQLKQENFIQKDQLQEIQDHTNQLDIDNNQLTHRMKQLKDLLEQRDQTIKRIHDKINEDKPNGNI